MFSLSRRRLLAGAAALPVVASAGSRSFRRERRSGRRSRSRSTGIPTRTMYLYLAQERGYFQAAGLDVELYTPSDPTVVLQTVGAGRDDFGISYQTDVLLARAQEVPVVSVAPLVQHPLMGVMALESAGITRPADLVGKTVGYPGIPSQDAFLATMLATDGASIDDIDLINVDFNLVPAVISGQTDAVMGAYWTHETIMAEQEGYPVTMMRVEEWGVPDYYELVLVSSEENAASNPDQIVALLGAIEQGYLDAISEPDAALAAMKTAYPELDETVERAGIGLLTGVWLDENGQWGVQTPARWTAYADWMKEAGLIPGDVDALKAFVEFQQARPAGESSPVAGP
ncbi:MAG: ABC transporter substrate-binding protein [Thermomicrobiales bacterium]|nr:ABC transporter substrate-binding protein [Thermomicrobiales bacterium]